MTSKFSLSVAVALLAFSPAMILSVPAEAFSLSLGGNAGGAGSASSGGTSTSGNANASLGLDLGLSSAGSTSASAAGTATASASGTGTLASASAGGEVQTVLSLIENSNWTTTTLSGRSSVSGAAAVDVAPMLNATTTVELNQALTANASDVGNLQTALSNNAAISAWLASQSVSASDVIAVGEAANGSLTFFTLD